MRRILVCTVAFSALAVAAGAQPRVAPAPVWKPELVGTLSPAAAAALGDPWKSVAPSRGPRPVGTGRDVRPLLRHSRVRPLHVFDAPLYPRGGHAIVVTTPQAAQAGGAVALPWYPTALPPSWRVVPEENPVQAWRVIDVQDLVCNAAGACAATSTRMLARWAPALRAYAFADRLGRVWKVE